jgi:adenylosuccinate synthase
VLAEGAQGSMLDVDFGTFPFVTSSSTITGGVCSGLGIAPQKIKEVIGITKAYCTRVGSGPFPTELSDDTGDFLRNTGNEFGSTTGRPRRCGWIDLVALQFACMINGVTQIVMTKADILDGLKELKVCNAYKVNGVETNQVPFQMNKMDIAAMYKSFAGWNTNITGVKAFADMPSQMNTYINYLNDFLKVPVKYISNGPGRDQLVSV